MRAVIAAGALTSLLAASSRAADGITPGVLVPALLALRRAVESGFKDADALRTEPDLDRIRRSPEFAALVDRARASPKVE